MKFFIVLLNILDKFMNYLFGIIILIAIILFTTIYNFEITDELIYNVESFVYEKEINVSNADYYWKIIQKYCRKYDMNPLLVLSIIKHESNFCITARSKKDAYGLMQLMDISARHMKVNRYIPEENIKGGIKYLRYLFNYYNNVPEEDRLSFVLAAYNAGMYKLRKYDNNIIEFRKNIEPVDNYIGKIIFYYHIYKHQFVSDVNPLKVIVQQK